MNIPLSTEISNNKLHCSEKVLEECWHAVGVIAMCWTVYLVLLLKELTEIKIVLEMRIVFILINAITWFIAW